MLAPPTWMRVLGVSLMGRAEEAAWHHMCTFSPKTRHTTGEMERSPRGGALAVGGSPHPQPRQHHARHWRGCPLVTSRGLEKRNWLDTLDRSPEHCV